MSCGSSEGVPSGLVSASLASSCPGESDSAFPAIVRTRARRLRDKWKRGIAVALGSVTPGIVGCDS